MRTHTVRAACPHDCPDTCATCAIRATVVDGIAVTLQCDPDDPPTPGAPCTTVLRHPERAHPADRVLRPMKRVGPKRSGRFEPVSWDAALADIAATRKAIAERAPRQERRPVLLSLTVRLNLVRLAAAARAAGQVLTRTWRLDAVAVVSGGASG